MGADVDVLPRAIGDVAVPVAWSASSAAYERLLGIVGDAETSAASPRGCGATATRGWTSTLRRSRGTDRSRRRRRNRSP